MPHPTQPRATVVSAPDSSLTLLRTVIAIAATATLLFLFAPRVIHAQDAAGTHKVEAGESLWILASKYYGDGQKWTELAKLNKLGDGGEKRLVVGQVIKIPDVKGVATKGPATPPANTSRNALARALQPTKPVAGSAPGALAAQTADKSDAAPKTVAIASKSSTSKTVNVAKAKPGEAKSAAARVADSARAVATIAAPAATTAPDARSALNAEAVATNATHIWGVDAATQRGARGNEGTTVFLKQTYDAAETENAVQAVLTVNKPRARTGEYSSAPYTVDATRFMKGATIGRRSGGQGNEKDVARLLLADEAELMWPPGTTAPAVGDRFVSVQSGTLLKPGVRVALPTGVLQVIHADAGRPIIVRVSNQMGLIEEGQHIFALEGVPGVSAGTTKSVARSAAGPETSVLWVESDALLPSVQSFVLLAAGEREGVKSGDEFALVNKVGMGAEAVEQRVAVVRVVRVTPFGSSALVTRQDQPAIAVGGVARLVAKAN